jgi:prepilin-type N-terminal cleavage/methylation domain-containing protein
MPRRDSAFTLVEILVSVAVLAMLIFLVSRLINSTATITTLAHKRMDGDGSARQLLDRIGIDLSQMAKRADLDYFAKNTAGPNSVGGAMSGNDQIAFYSSVPGFSAGAPSPISLVAYRINGQNQLERMGKGLLWNGAPSSSSPVVFLPLTISGIWPAATDQTSDTDYELIGPQVFRFEYYYLLNNGRLSTTPWNTGVGHTSVSGMQDVTAIAVAIAMIDAKSKVLISPAQLAALTGNLNDFVPSMNPGDLLSQWQSTIDGTSGVPRPALQGVRLYERYFYFSK